MPHRTLDDNPAGLPDQKLLEEAADWAIAFQYETPDPRREAQFREWHGLSAAHEQAWERARQVFATFGQVPTPLTREVLERLNHASARRRTCACWRAGPCFSPSACHLPAISHGGNGCRMNAPPSANAGPLPCRTSRNSR